MRTFFQFVVMAVVFVAAVQVDRWLWLPAIDHVVDAEPLGTAKMIQAGSESILILLIPFLVASILSYWFLYRNLTPEERCRDAEILTRVKEDLRRERIANTRHPSVLIRSVLPGVR